MQKPRYKFQSEPCHLIYRFESEGPKGIVKKMVEYTKMSGHNIYNLGFGDYDENTDSFDDFVVTDNHDAQKVLTTVASTVFTFSANYPKAWVLATGSTPVRTRLYQMLINSNLPEIQLHFFIFGYTIESSWENFKAGVTYQSFLLVRKENQIHYETI